VHSRALFRTSRARDIWRDDERKWRRKREWRRRRRPSGRTDGVFAGRVDGAGSGVVLASRSSLHGRVYRQSHRQRVTAAGQGRQGIVGRPKAGRRCVGRGRGRREQQAEATGPTARLAPGQVGRRTQAACGTAAVTHTRHVHQTSQVGAATTQGKGPSVPSVCRSIRPDLCAFPQKEADISGFCFIL